MNQPMDFRHNLCLLLQKNGIRADLSPKGKDLGTASLCLFQIINSDLANIGFEDIDCNIVFGL
jgi:hypothetical protein